VLLAAYAGIRLDGALHRRAALRAFEAARVKAAAPVPVPAPVPAPAPAAPPPATLPGLSEFRSPDRSLWSPERVRAFEETLSRDDGIPLAVLRVPKIGLEVPVLEGTDNTALNRGVGHIAHTPPPGEPGNVGVAGHRDGFFRGLKDVSEGDAIEVETLRARQRYTIRSISIVSPDRVDVLNPTEEPTLTLVTCYPFYYVGDAPQRYIVQATLDATGR
jgi:sortase A